ncbi:aldo/keto reductase [Pseudomonas matsuisoli]|uniref:Oxidoreductase n=1 Tax=Pseudomonas matsuisoli TaxID=1515666 RepID=A0A917PSQ3_9PSED|nr:aldo/keto reductase [Pseudomonas matsuisoli]GGJ90146.1 oxidoreductase [Pseudomonas matsuisoli]
MKMLEFADGTPVPRIGQGTWRMGEVPSERQREVSALQLGIEQGMTLIDTAEMYGEGGAEKIVGQAIEGRRDRVYLVSKVYPHNASRRGVIDACERSLRRLGTDRIDLYLLHWQGSYPLEETVEAFEQLQRDNKIGQWGVSNFDTSDMQALEALDLSGCATNQVIYNPSQRGIEFDLIPWAKAREMPLMAYCPLGQGNELLTRDVLVEIARRHDCGPAQIALAWALRQDGLIAIPKAAEPAHVKANAAAMALVLTADDLDLIDRALPAPTRKRPLVIV